MGHPAGFGDALRDPPSLPPPGYFLAQILDGVGVRGGLVEVYIGYPHFIW
jgi:hypothetical protein